MMWERVSSLSNNEVLRADGFYISYASNPFFASDNNSDETALCKDGKYYILNGNYKKDYESLIKDGFDACFSFYKSKINERSSWSD